MRNGGAIINDGGYAVTISQPLLHSNIAGDNATDGGLTKLGNGTLTLTANNTYNGGTTINAGILALGNDNALGTAGLSMSGGSLDIHGYGPAITTLNGSAGTIGNTSSDDGSLLIVNNGGTFAGMIVDGLARPSTRRA